MAEAMAPDHPKQRLLFFVAQDLDERVRAAVRELIARLSESRSWVNGPPRLVQDRNEAVSSPGDMPIETVGGYIEIYSALPPWTLPRDVDRQHLEEVEQLVSAICQFSRNHKVAFELELDGTFVGAVEHGEMDRSLAEGLLGEWRRVLRPADRSG
jgi:hypothetical protein